MSEAIHPVQEKAGEDGQADTPYANPQLQCPLFTKTPPELRSEIFELAVSQHEDFTQSYPEYAYHYRPGHHAMKRVFTNLLLTCRRIYWETEFIPMRSTTHDLWFDRGPSKKLDFTRLTEKNVENLYHVHFFTQLYRLESRVVDGYNNLPQFRPKKITITVRHSDWWYWEQDAPLRITDQWTSTFKAPNELQQLKIEFETIERKKGQLDTIIQKQVLGWQFKLKDNTPLEVTGSEASSWTGRSDLDNRKWRFHGSGPEMKYYVVVITWRPAKS